MQLMHGEGTPLGVPPTEPVGSAFLALAERRNRELAAISAAIRSISRASDLAHVLQSIADAVRELIQSRYAALGVANDDGRLIQFITSGLTPDERAAIGPLPEGHGLLGALIKEGTPLRIPTIGNDPRSSGFPPNHPPMKSLLGVPIVLHGQPVGDLYLTDKIGADQFSEDDQALLMLFAEHAAVAIENARLYEALTSARDQLEARNRQLEEQYNQVNEANRLKSEFLANMSHELRTPLNAIIGFAELMHDARVGPVSADHKEYLGDILTSSRHLLRIINDILDLSKIESGKIDLHPRPVDISTIVAETREILRSIAAEKHIAIEVEIDPALDDIVADPLRLKQIIYNFLSNAVKFTPEHGSVVIRVRSDGTDSFRIEVEDTGIGIQPEDLHRLFSEFQQLDAGTSKQYQGTGLGLALTSRIVEAQDGKVGVCSIFGIGSTFHAVLPRTATAFASTREGDPLDHSTVP